MCSNGLVSANINGVDCVNNTISIVQLTDMHPHLSEQAHCGCGVFDNGTSHDYFGAYWHTVDSFSCTVDGDSTTQWWYGSLVDR